MRHNSKFHAIFATSSIPEAINYYPMIKEMIPELKVTALFDPNIDNCGGVEYKEAGLAQIIEDYNERYGQSFTIPTFSKMKNDIATRLAHKKPYERIASEPEKQIDLIIVVDQMLTGFDSRWINTLYLDKVLLYDKSILCSKYNQCIDKKVLYIGKATGKNGLQQRLKQYVLYGYNKSIIHKGGRAIWQLENSKDFMVEYACVDNPEEIEKQLIIKYKEQNNGAYPLANWRL